MKYESKIWKLMEKNKGKLRAVEMVALGDQYEYQGWNE